MRIANKMAAHVNITPEKVLTKIFNKISDEENYDIEDIAFLLPMTI